MLRKKLACACLFAVVAMSACSGEIDQSGPQDEREEAMQFNASDWKNEDMVYGDPPIRAAMLDDLMTNELRIGMAQADVEALLGPPTDTEKFADHDLVYWVGEEQGFIALDSRWLAIDFDDDGGLSRTSVVSD